jgi:hypothetical protein
MAEDLPRLGADLAKILRDTEKFTQVAAALRRAQKGIDAAVERWPELRQALGRSSTVLRTAQGQLERALQQRQQYEDALEQTVVLADAFAEMLPLYTAQLEQQLAEQEHTLGELGASIDEIGQSASSLMQLTRLLVWLMAVIFGVHGCYLALDVLLARPRPA